MYEFTREMMTIAGAPLPKGSKLHLISRTEEAPHGFKDPAGNWWVDGPNGRSIWSSVRHGIEEGTLRLVMQVASNEGLSRFGRIDREII